MDRAASLLKTDLIAIGYLPTFLLDPVGTAVAPLNALGFDLISPVYGVDFKGLFGQETVPYGVKARSRATGRINYAFRGTDDAKEWLEDAWALPEVWGMQPGVCSHRGFTDLIHTFTDMNGRPITEEQEPCDIEGHSLGAAEAELFSAILGPLCLCCETFEGPRVFNQMGADWMNSRVGNHFRNVIIGDIVPHAPPENLGYVHAGTEIDWDPSGIIPLTLDPVDHFKYLHIMDSVRRILLAA
jgi:Lipase (class 3)